MSSSIRKAWLELQKKSLTRWRNANKAFFRTGSPAEQQKQQALLAAPKPKEQAESAGEPTSAGHLVNREFFLSQLTANDMSNLGGHDYVMGLSAADLEKLYLQTDWLQAFDPNPHFNESWYRWIYQDVGDAIREKRIVSGLMHFLLSGWNEGRLPNAAFYDLVKSEPSQGLADPDKFDAAEYLKESPDAAEFLSAFPFATAAEYYNRIGRFKSRAPAKKGKAAARHNAYDILRPEFDEQYYSATYLKGADAAKASETPFEHYVTYGLKEQHSPNNWFEEGFYVSYYPDVRKAIDSGALVCGFEHYIRAGRAEGRLPRRDVTRTLESALPGVTKPVLKDRVRSLAAKLAPPRVNVAADQPQTVWFILPRLNADIAFGGFKSCFELMGAVKRHYRNDAIRIGVILTEEGTGRIPYFIWANRGGSYAELITGAPIQSTRETTPLQISPADMFVVYSVLDAHLATKLCEYTANKTFVILVQEHESIFFDHGAMHAFCEESFKIPSFPIFNTRLLADYFKQNNLGIFARLPAAAAGADFATFEHVLNKLPRQKLNDIRGRSVRNCLVYARPEQHAARNLYEVVELGLKSACERGLFEGAWNFLGLGSLSDIEPVDLGNGHWLQFERKLSEAEYRERIREVDIGISLMYAPHPSVVPFELCSTGAIVVTNTFQNRTQNYFKTLSRNFVACEASVSGLVSGLQEALRLVEDADSRIKHALPQQKADWPSTFSEQFVRDIFDRFLFAHGRRAKRTTAQAGASAERLRKQSKPAKLSRPAPAKVIRPRAQRVKAAE